MYSRIDFLFSSSELIDELHFSIKKRKDHMWPNLAANMAGVRPRLVEIVAASDSVITLKIFCSIF